MEPIICDDVWAEEAYYEISVPGTKPNGIIELLSRIFHRK